MSRTIWCWRWTGWGARTRRRRRRRPGGESLAALAALVAPGGRLVLGVRNDLGVDRFVEAGPPDRDGGDDQWEPHGFDPTYPDGPGALDAGAGVGRA